MFCTVHFTHRNYIYTKVRYNELAIIILHMSIYHILLWELVVTCAWWTSVSRLDVWTLLPASLLGDASYNMNMNPKRALSSKHTSISNILLSNIGNTSVLFTPEQQSLFTWNVNFQYVDSVNTVRQFWYRKRQNYPRNGNKCGLMLSMEC